MNIPRILLVLAPLVLLPMQGRAEEYVPGMTCEQVGDFAEAVVREKSMGDSLKEQIAGMHQSIPGYKNTAHALEKIIRAIYARQELPNASPEAVNATYRKACDLVSQPR